MFLAAIVPLPGMSVLERVAAEADVINPAWKGKDPSNDEVAREFLFHDCTPGVLEWALATRRTMFAWAALSETHPLNDWPDVPYSSIVCTDDRTISPAWSRKVARERLHVEAIELAGGHCPHVCRPAVLADLLVSI